MAIILQDLSNMARFCQMVIILQERAVGDDWRVAEAASWDFGGTRATIWGGPTHYSENQPQEMGPENGERKRVKRLGRPEPPFGEDQPTIQKTHLQEMGKENGSKDGGSTATIWAVGEDVKNFLLHSSFQSQHFGATKPKMGRREFSKKNYGKHEHTKWGDHLPKNWIPGRWKVSIWCGL